MTIEFNKSPQLLKPDWHQSDFNRITVTTRRHDEVLPELMLPDSYLLVGSTVLDVGAGFSDTIDYLNSTCEIKGVSVDPIYTILENGGVSMDQINNAITEKYESYVMLNTLYSRHKGIHVPSPENRLTESVYSLGKAFSSETVDLIISNRLMEHIDLSKALPEMVYALKSDGEIRFSGCLLNIDGNRKKLYSGVFEHESDGFIEQYGFLPTKGFVGAINFAYKEDLSIYVLATKLPQSSKILKGVKGSEDEIYLGGLMIIRKDKKLPTINSKYKMNGSPGLPDKYTHIGELYSVGGCSTDDSKSLLVESFGFDEVELYNLTSITL